MRSVSWGRLTGNGCRFSSSSFPWMPCAPPPTTGSGSGRWKPSATPPVTCETATPNPHHRLHPGPFSEDLSWVGANPNLFHPQTITQPPADIWQDYLSRPAHYQGLMATLLGREIKGADEHLDATTLQRIRDLTLNTTHVHDLHLRGYQSFGACFSVIQKKILLGDETWAWVKPSRPSPLPRT